MRKTLLILAIAMAAVSARADDFGMWGGVSLGQNLGVRGLDASIDLDFRANNSLRNVDRWGAGVGLSYDIFPFLKVAAAYSYLYTNSLSERKEHYKDDIVSEDNWNGYNTTHAYWRNKHRVAFDIKSGFNIRRLKLSLRERYQYTHYDSVSTIKDKHRFNAVYDADDNKTYEEKSDSPETVADGKSSKNKQYLRSKVEATYDIRNCRFTPSLSVEFMNNLRDAFNLDEVRYVAGVEYKIARGIRIGASYHYHDGHDDDSDDNMHAIEITLKLKNLFWPAKK